ncbi:hypothetical protein P389DRAFT_140326 [Cystobasidium minutum MCA 4210]|uniref:uncharacterized protein n=1 Tax=Cystobasidium minutum MCA 4210 TaxID=1397322 RepID=UPI0034CF0205|eukprot:jgi/Rhomi1/140326/e_gw1.2.979.1
MRFLRQSSTFRDSRPLAPTSLIEAAVSRHLTQGQCMTFFPGLYAEADRAAQYWADRGGVTLETFQAVAAKHEGATRILIYDNELYILHYGGSINSRMAAALAMINSAVLTSTEIIPNIEIILHTADAGGVGEDVPLFVLDRKAKEQSLWLMPDFGFYSWPEPKVGTWSEILRKADQWDAKMSWKEKIPKLFWKGVFMVDVRKQLESVTRGKEWADIQDINWGDKATVMPMDEHCKYKFLAHAEGWAYSGRLKYLLACRSVVVAHEMQFIQHFHHLMDSQMNSTTQNIVIIPGQKWEQLPATMSTMLEDDDFSEALAERSHKFWRYYLSPASIDCYWRYLFQRWADVQRFTPELKYEYTPYASFMLTGRTDWDPHRR